MSEVGSNRASAFHELNQFNCIALNTLLINLVWFLMLFLQARLACAQLDLKRNSRLKGSSMNSENF